MVPNIITKYGSISIQVNKISYGLRKGGHIGMALKGDKIGMEYEA